MGTQYQTLKGYVKWTKVYEPDSFSGAENWKINFYPFDGSEWEKFQKTGLQLTVKEDIDGKFVTFRRPTKKLIKDELVIFSPPEVTGKVNVKYVDEEGNKVRQYNKGDKILVTRVGEPDIIPNGSLVLLNYSYYQTVKGAGHRLEGINVLELAEYERKETPVTPKEEAPVTPEPKSEVKTKAKKEEKIDSNTVSEELNDEIPW